MHPFVTTADPHQHLLPLLHHAQLTYDTDSLSLHFLHHNLLAQLQLLPHVHAFSFMHEGVDLGHHVKLLEVILSVLAAYSVLDPLTSQAHLLELALV